MTRLRRRVVLGTLLGAAIALVGGASIAADPHARAIHPFAASLAPREPVVVSVPGAPAAPDATDAPATRASRSASHHGEVAIGGAPAHFSGAAPKAVAPPAQINSAYSSQTSRAAGTWAVVIGINDYPGTENDLEAAVNDANDMSTALSGMGVDANHQLVLRDGQATSRTLLAAIDWLSAHASSDAVAVFFYAGHVRKTGNTNEEIVTSDGSSVTDAQLARALNTVQASRSWVAIAACYGGGFDEVLRPGRVLTAAAGANDIAYENSAIGRSYMVEYMVHQAMIERQAPETVETAFNYAVDAIHRDYPGREPVEVDDSADGNLALNPPGVAPPQRSSQPPSGPSSSDDGGSTPPPSSGGSSGDGQGPKQHCTQSGIVRYCTNG